jgi:D-alanine transaminase/branched-chain amino acid aminotransferase
MSQQYVLINNEFFPKETASIRINDLAIQRGYGIFDFLKTIEGRPIYLDDHLQRFYNSAEAMFLPVEMSKTEIINSMLQLIKKNRLANSGIRITLTGGYSEDGYQLSKPNLIISQSPYTYQKENFEKGCRLITYPHQRQLPAVKTTDYLQAIRLQPLIKQQQADDVLYIGTDGIAECPRSNFFLVTENDEIITPASNVLNGITRKKILEINDMPVKTAKMDAQMLYNAKEAFITSTTKIILPVLQINELRMGNGRPGEVTRALFSRLLQSLEA